MTTIISDKHFPWEGAFVLETFRNLRLPVCVNAETSYMFLSRQVQRYPKGLAFHVCRIDRALCMNNEEAVYAAVLDFFYILEDKGQEFRQRILNKVSNHLSEELKFALEQAVSGQIPSRGLPFSSRSVLHDGMHSDDQELVIIATTTSSNQSTDLDPVNTARLCLESGQLEQAQEILESQLKIEPERVAIRRDLLEIYRATQDAEGFRSSYHLLKTHGCLDKSWDEAISLFTTLKLVESL
ncbi:MAG: hypothetical protein V3V18_15595 [Methylococcales bacterium]